ncbi:MAG: undecaprenyl-diphosphate phosphatase [Treponema sp.]|nr:undecaprenyl-diphosphate phosphatase [Treponema sp.]
MSVFQGIILGVLQGIAEFLPVSSSGHLALAQHLLGLSDVPLLYDVFLHIATLCAVMLFFRKKIVRLLCVFGRMILRKSADEDELACRRYIAGVILATAVTGVIGIIVEKKLDNLPIKFVCAGFLLTSVLLVLSSVVEKRRHQNESLEVSAAGSAPSWRQSLAIGFAQGIGTLPGVSRSGSTISGALLCGVTREVAGEFSFIASIPAILGAFILELKDFGQVSSSVGIAPVAAGCIAAFVSGIFALAWLMKLIRKGKLAWFACYLVPAGILGILFL